MGPRLPRLALVSVVLAAGLVAPPPAGAQPPAVSTVLPLQPPNLPEGLVVDEGGVAYVGLASAGEIWRVAPDGTRAVLATLRPGLGSLLGLALDSQGNVLAALASQNTPGSDRHGVWRISPSGEKTLLAPLPGGTMPNDVLVGPDGAAYVSESMRGAIWRVAPDGTATRWVEDELLQGDLTACPPPILTGAVGANGMVLDPQGGLLVANTTKGQIVRVPLNADGSAGRPEVRFGPQCEALAGADGLALDTSGRLYVTLNWQHRLVRIAPGGEQTVLATRADGLDFPASVDVRGGRLYLTNYALISYLRNEGPRPSLMTAEGS